MLKPDPKLADLLRRILRAVRSWRIMREAGYSRATAARALLRIVRGSFRD